MSLSPERPHPGRASSITLRLIDMVLGADSPQAAIPELEKLREELRGRWEGELSLGEAGEIDQMLAELEVVLADLRQVVERRYPQEPLPPSDVEERESEEEGGQELRSPPALPAPPASTEASPKDEFPPDARPTLEGEIRFLGKGVSGLLGRHDMDDERLAQLDLPVIAGPHALARWLGITARQLRWLAFHDEAARFIHYTQFAVPKRSGGERVLSSPTALLARVQRLILDILLARLPVEPSCHGFVPGRSIVSNAAVHAGQAVVVNLDLENFFPSITLPRVRRVFEHCGYSPALSTILGLLCTESQRQEVHFAGEKFFIALGPRGLPQGACTSPALSNQVARRLDRRLGGLAGKIGFNYTRYADDLSFSGPDANEGLIGYLLTRVRNIALSEGFRIQERKTRVLRRNAAQVVTGLVVNDRPGVPRDEVRRLRAILHRARSEGLEAQNREGVPCFRAWLLGKIAYIKMARPEVGARLLADFLALADARPTPPQPDTP